MNQSGNQAAGLLGSLRRLADTGLAIVHNRVELFAVEVQEQKAHVIEVLLLVSVLLFFAMLCVLLLTSTIIFLFAQPARIYVAAGFSLLYLVGTLWAFWRLKLRLKYPVPFSETISEVRKDREWLIK